MSTTTNKRALYLKFGPGSHDICRKCDVAFIKKDGSCALCGDVELVYPCGGPKRCAWCKNEWPRWTEEQETKE